jgi:hypothetical protein
MRTVNVTPGPRFMSGGGGGGRLPLLQKGLLERLRGFTKGCHGVCLHVVNRPHLLIGVVIIAVVLVWWATVHMFEHTLHGWLLQGVVMWTDVRASRVMPCLTDKDLLATSPVVRLHAANFASAAAAAAAAASIVGGGSGSPAAGSAAVARRASRRRLPSPEDEASRAAAFTSTLAPESTMARAMALTGWELLSEPAALAHPPVFQSLPNISLPLWLEAQRMAVSCHRPLLIYKAVSLVALGVAVSAEATDENNNEILRHVRQARGVGVSGRVVCSVNQSDVYF